MSKLTINRILIPFDFSETAKLALEHACFMAKLKKAEIILLHVVETPGWASSITSAFGKAQNEYEANLESGIKQKMEAIATELHHKDSIVVNFRAEKGKIYKVINEVAEELKADLIIMGTHGSSGFQEFLIGSNAYKVVSSAPCPVLTVQTHATKVGFKDIVLPIDNSPTSRQKVVHAAELARLYNSVVHVLGFMTMGDTDLQRKFEHKINQVTDYLDEKEVANSSKMLKGGNINNATATMEYAQSINADLVIIMTEQDGGSLLMGSYAQQVVNHSKTPILSIKPDEGDPDRISVGY
ncbi:MAG: hypothetical protein RIQ89_48 [Bacteroidota bacterium]|jgi:nucleotide-binding universal stress UspA family protein